MENELAQALVSRGGYNPTDAANASRGPRAAELAREFLGANTSQSTPSGATTTPQTDIAGIARQFLQLQQEANKPAVSSLQTQVPEIQAGFAQQKTQLEAKKEPLKARYDAILNQLKGKEQQEVTQTQTALGREYGRRGIPTSSGMFEQNLLEKTQPISQQYAGLTTEAGLGREEALQGIESQISNLPFQEQEQTRAVINAIAQLQSGGNAQAIQNALSQFQFGENQRTAQESAAAQSAQSAAEQAFRERTYQDVTLPESQASIANIRSQISERGRTSPTNESSALQTIFGGGKTAGEQAFQNLINKSQAVNPLDAFWK